MANIMFKKGSYSDFKTKVLEPKNIVDGALYITEDEGSLYLGKVVDGVKSVKRIQGSVVFYEDDLTFIGEVIKQPPYSSDLIYFISKDNALIRWDETKSKWVQLNATADDVNVSLSNLQIAIDNLGEDIGDLQDIVSGTDGKGGLVKSVADNAAAAAEADRKATAAQNDLDTLEALVGNSDTEGLRAKIKANEVAVGNAQNAIDTLAGKVFTKTEIENNYATKTYAQEQAANVLGKSGDTATTTTVYGALAAAAAAHALADDANKDANQALTDADNAQKAADNAQEAADAAQDRADEAWNLANGKTTMAEVEAKNYATQTQAQGYAKAVQGDTNKTVKDAMTAANNAQQAADAAQSAADLKLPLAGGTVTGPITLPNTDPTNNLHATTKQYVDNKISSAIAANDAMTFMGVVRSSDQLPAVAGSTNRGDTYKVGVAGKYAGVDAKVGDLFINTAADGATPKWEHVSSGYESEYNQKLIVNNGAIKLTDGVSETTNFQGSISFAGATGTNVTTSVSTAGVVTIGMEWGSF